MVSRGWQAKQGSIREPHRLSMQTGLEVHVRVDLGDGKRFSSRLGGWQSDPISLRQNESSLTAAALMDAMLLTTTPSSRVRSLACY